jgi:hypothetical protein
MAAIKPIIPDSYLVFIKKYEPTGSDTTSYGYTGDPADGNSDPEDYDDPYSDHGDDEEEIPQSEYTDKVIDALTQDPDNDVDHEADNTVTSNSKDDKTSDKVSDAATDEAKEHENNENAENSIHGKDQHRSTNELYQFLMEKEIEANKGNNEKTWKAGNAETESGFKTQETLDMAIDVLCALKLYHRLISPLNDTNIFSSAESFAAITKKSINGSHSPAEEKTEWEAEYILRMDGRAVLKATDIIPIIRCILENEIVNWEVEQIAEVGCMSANRIVKNNIVAPFSNNLKDITEGTNNEEEEEREL